MNELFLESAWLRACIMDEVGFWIFEIVIFLELFLDPNDNNKNPLSFYANSTDVKAVHWYEGNHLK